MFDWFRMVCVYCTVDLVACPQQYYSSPEAVARASCTRDIVGSNTYSTMRIEEGSLIL